MAAAVEHIFRPRVDKASVSETTMGACLLSTAHQGEYGPGGSLKLQLHPTEETLAAGRGWHTGHPASASLLLAQLIS